MGTGEIVLGVNGAENGVGLEGRLEGVWIRARRHYSEAARSRTDLSAKAHLFCGCCFGQRS